jgi:hypothetical protein
MAGRTGAHLGSGPAALLGVLLAVLLATAGCGSTTDPASADKPAPTASDPARPLPDLDTTLPPSVPLSRIQQQRVPLAGGGGPDWMAVGFGSLWVRRDNAVITRLAPDGRVQATIDAGIWQQPVCQGLGVSAVAVWGCATEGRLERVNPRTNQVDAIVAIPKVNEQGRLTAWGDRVWVLTGDGDKLTPVSEKTNQPGPPIELGAFCVDVSDRVVGSTLWVVCPYDGVALSVDLRAGRVTGRVPGLDGATEIAADERRVWVCTPDGVVRVDPAGPAASGIQRVPIGTACSIRLIGDTLWLRGQGANSPFLTAVDADSGRITQLVDSPVVKLNAGDVVGYAGSLWVAAFDGEVVFRTRPPGF